jgi:aspartyl-tRNA(Asn)/glutamyl-tRNA(Gln) amidotransferase subunit C
MTSLNADQVRHIAKLARLRLTPDEVEKMSKELSSILKYVDTLSEVQTDGVAPTAQVTGQDTVLRDDVVLNPPLASPDDLLASSPLSITSHQITSPSAHG